MTVRSPKTEHHVGHEQRVVPIVSRLMTLLQDAFDSAETGEERIVTLGRGGQLHRRLQAIVKTTGVEPWPRVFQTLRSSCEKEWAMDFPQYAVSKWIGHSITVSGKHYANAVPDELLDRAAGLNETQAVQNAAQHAAASARTASQTPREVASPRAHKPSECEGLQDYASVCDEGKKWSRGESNPRAGAVNKSRLHA